MSIIAKFALNRGMNQHVFVTYRMAIATVIMAPFAIVLERRSRPNLSFSMFAKIMLLSLSGPVLDQNLYYTGMKYTTATFTSAMCNILPALTFLMALVFRLERVDIRSRHSQAKILGTAVTVGGAMFMTLVKGPILHVPWLRGNHHLELHSTSPSYEQHHAIGALMIIAGCFSWSIFSILQAVILKSYPLELSLTALMCFCGTVEGVILTLIVERGNVAVWKIQLDIKLLAALYGGIVSGIGYYVIGMIIKRRGPVFMSAFNPLSMIIVALVSSFVFAEKMHLGRALGAVIIVVGLYMVLWGKSNHTINEAASDHLESVAAV